MNGRAGVFSKPVESVERPLLSPHFLRAVTRAVCCGQYHQETPVQGAKIVVCGSQTSYSEGLDLSPGWDLWAIGDIDDVCARHPSTELFLFNGFESREQGPFFPIS